MMCCADDLITFYLYSKYFPLYSREDKLRGYWWCRCYLKTSLTSGWQNLTIENKYNCCNQGVFHSVWVLKFLKYSCSNFHQYLLACIHTKSLIFFFKNVPFLSYSYYTKQQDVLACVFDSDLEFVCYFRVSNGVFSDDCIPWSRAEQPP